MLIFSSTKMYESFIFDECFNGKNIPQIIFVFTHQSFTVVAFRA